MQYRLKEVLGLAEGLGVLAAEAVVASGVGGEFLLEGERNFWNGEFLQHGQSKSFRVCSPCKVQQSGFVVLQREANGVFFCP